MKALHFLNLLSNNNFGPFSGVPCSLVKDLISEIEISPSHQYYSATSEGEAIGLAAGQALAGKLPVVLLQNDGYGNTVNPLSSLQLMFHLPVLMLITWRSMPGQKDAEQHKIMGETIIDLLKIFNIPTEILETDETKLSAAIKNARIYMHEHQKPFAFIIKKDFFENSKSAKIINTSHDFPKRYELIDLVFEQLNKNDVVFATTGYTGREAVSKDRSCPVFYMAGSMGCLPSLGLGFADQNKNKRIFLLDGDGALLMKMGSLATIGHYQPKNITHIVFDNQAYESTGSQKTVSENAPFYQIAKSCGYQHTCYVSNTKDFLTKFHEYKSLEGPKMIHVRVQPGTLEKLNRPEEKGTIHKQKFIRDLKNCD